jgi:23S rRNA pseudouridine1911/1915/1917 synthase
MKDVPFYPNNEDNSQCMVAVYRSIFDYILGQKFTERDMQTFVGYRKDRAAWTIKALTQMAGMGFDIRMIEPFDYREYAKRGRAYLEELFPKAEADWQIAHSNVLDIPPLIPDFLRTVPWEKRRASLQDIDAMLAEGYVVFVILNSRALNDNEGFLSHCVLIIGRVEGSYIVHDPGLPPMPYRHIARQKLWEAMGKSTHTAEVTGFRPKTHIGKRLDHYVVSQHPQLSRSFATQLIEDGKVLVKGVPRKPSYKIREGDGITIDYKSNAPTTVPEISLPVLYEDDECVVIDKPVGILTHSKGAFNPEATVASWLNSRVKGGLEGKRAGIVHRLDRATSGVMIGAKTPEALSWLQKQFSTRKVKKTYYAVVPGHMPHEHAIIDMPIMRNPKKPQTFRTGSNGKVAITEYWVESQSTDYTLLKLQPQTGRTHQLRVHLSEIGHPIVGDTLYDGEPAERLFLHACQLELSLPNRTPKTFTATLPQAFRAMIKS